MLGVFKEEQVGQAWLELNEKVITYPRPFLWGVSAVELLSARMRVGVGA